MSLMSRATAAADSGASFFAAETVTIDPSGANLAHPQLVYGTYKVGVVPASASEGAAAPPRGTLEVVLDALKAGYRALDCAQFYANEAAVGEAIARSGVPREDLFLISKVWNDTTFAGPDAVKAQVRRACADLKTTYLDLFLVHWPVPGKHIAAYKALEELQAEGVLKAIGVANYTIEDLDALMADDPTRRPPAVNQIEINPFLYRKTTIAAFEARGVRMQSYRALQQCKSLDHPLLVELAAKYAHTAPQVLGRWCVQKGFVYLAKTEKATRMVENAQVFGWTIEDADVARLDSLTTPASIEVFRELYFKCIVRDTPIAGTMDDKSARPARTLE